MEKKENTFTARTGYLWAIHVVEVEDDRCPLIEG